MKPLKFMMRNSSFRLNLYKFSSSIQSLDLIFNEAKSASTSQQLKILQSSRKQTKQNVVKVDKSSTLKFFEIQLQKKFSPSALNFEKLYYKSHILSKNFLQEKHVDSNDEFVVKIDHLFEEFLPETSTDLLSVNFYELISKINLEKLPVKSLLKVLFVVDAFNDVKAMREFLQNIFERMFNQLFNMTQTEFVISCYFFMLFLRLNNNQCDMIQNYLLTHHSKMAPQDLALVSLAMFRSEQMIT